MNYKHIKDFEYTRDKIDNKVMEQILQDLRAHLISALTHKYAFSQRA